MVWGTEKPCSGLLTHHHFQKRIKDKCHGNVTHMIRKHLTSCALKSIRDLVVCDSSYDSYDHSTQKNSSAQKDSSARTHMNSMKLSFHYSHCTGQFTPKMKANAVPRLTLALWCHRIAWSLYFIK